MAQPTPTELAVLDQAVIDAGRAYAAALAASPFDQAAADAARQALEQAREARGYAPA